MLADNGIAVSSFDNNNESVFEDMTVIGLTAKAREFSVSLNPPISSGLNKETGICRFCHHSISGVKFASDPSHTQLSLQNVSFSGFEPHFDGTTEYDILALRLWGAFPGMHGAGGKSINIVVSMLLQFASFHPYLMTIFVYAGTILHGSECCVVCSAYEYYYYICFLFALMTSLIYILHAFLKTTNASGTCLLLRE